jgi:hypothetical protein
VDGGPSPDLDQRWQRHQRHRAPTGRRRTRSPDPAGRPGRAHHCVAPGA